MSTAQRCASLRGLHWAAAPGRTHPVGPLRQLQPPSQASSVLSATGPSAPASSWAAGTRDPAASTGPLLRGGSKGQGTSTDLGLLGQGWAKPTRTRGCPTRGAAGALCLAHRLPGPWTLLAEQGAGCTPCHGAAAPSPQRSQPVWAGSCCWRVWEEGPQPGLSHLSVRHRQRRVRPEQPTWCRNTMHSLMQVVPFNGAKAENPSQVTQASVPSHLTQPFALLQLLLQLKCPAKEGEQKRFFFFS